MIPDKALAERSSPLQPGRPVNPTFCTSSLCFPQPSFLGVQPDQVSRQKSGSQRAWFSEELGGSSCSLHLTPPQLLEDTQVDLPNPCCCLTWPPSVLVQDAGHTDAVHQLTVTTHHMASAPEVSWKIQSLEPQLCHCSALPWRWARFTQWQQDSQIKARFARGKKLFCH